MKIAIISRSPEFASYVRKDILKFFSDKGYDASCDVFVSGLKFIEQTDEFYDCAFVDGDKSDIDGYECVKLLKARDKYIFAVIVGDDAGGALMAYKVNAIGYIAKPFDFGRMTELLEMRDKTGWNVTTVSVKNIDGRHRIAAGDILYAETYRHRVTLHTFYGDIEYWSSIKVLRGILTEEQGFAMCNTCYLVNLKQVRGVFGDYVLVGAQLLKISRGKKNYFLDRLKSFTGK